MTFRTRHDAARIQSWNWQHAAALGLLMCTTSCSTVDKFGWKNSHKADPIAAVDAAQSPSSTSTDASKSPQRESVAKVAVGENADHVEGVAKSRPGLKTDSPMGRAIAKALPSKAVGAEQGETMSKIKRGEDPFSDFHEDSTKIEQVSAEFSLDNAGTKTASATQDRSTSKFDGSQNERSSQFELSDQALDESEATNSNSPFAVVTKMARQAPAFPLTVEQEDEYIRDGGDRGHQVGYVGQDRTGLEVQDTVVEFRNSNGEFQVKATNEAFVYAPRFGEVRTATLPQEGLSVTKASGHQDQQNLVSMEAKQVSTEQVQRDELKGMQSRSRVSGLGNLEANANLSKDVTARNHVKLVNVHEDLAFIQEGRFDKVSSANLAEAQAAAVEWSDGRQAIIIAQDVTGSLVQARAAAQDFTGVEDRRPDGELELIKVADKTHAHPGDTITFTIRFDNIGGKDLGHIRVVDNLSPRLEYIAGSIESNLDGEIDIQDNIQGGKLLTFEFEQILKAKTGGFISFKCRVR